MKEESRKIFCYQKIRIRGNYFFKKIIYFFKPLEEYPDESNISWTSFIYPTNLPTWTTDKNIIYIE